MVDFTTIFVEGKVYWAKIVGNKALHDNYDKDGREWSYELVPDDTTFLKEHRLLDRLKDNPDPQNPDKGEYLYLKKPEFNKDGDKNDPITILDSDNEPWSGKLLGNGTRVVAKLTIADFGRGKKKAIWTSAIRVEEHVPYEGNGEYDDSDPFGSYNGGKSKTATKSKPKTKAKTEELDGLDDDMPF